MCLCVCVCECGEREIDLLIDFKELAHIIMEAANLKSVWQAGSSGKSWCCSLESEFFRAAGWKLRVGFCVAVLRRIPSSWEKPQSLLLRPSTDWVRPTTLWRVICFTHRGLI